MEAARAGANLEHVARVNHHNRARLGRNSAHAEQFPGQALMVTENGGVIATLDGRDYVAGVTGSYLLAGADPSSWEVGRTVVRENFGC